MNLPSLSSASSILATLTERAFDIPALQDVLRVVRLEDYNTRVVVLSTAVLGLAAGLVGSFTLLRRRALMGDALAHATLPGICIAFITATLLKGDGKSLTTLLLGAAVSGLLGVAAILLIRRITRLKEDTALGIVLSVFFGAGTALMTVIQQMESGHAAGLESFIYGKTASMTAEDTKLILASALVCTVVSCLLFKELKLLCFDESFAGSRGYSVLFLDIVLMALVVTITIVGLQSVGMILIIALMIIPAASARFWTDEMFWLAIWSSILGTVSCLVGAMFSAIIPRLPSGAMIVLVAAFVFFVSMLAGKNRGILVRSWRRHRVNTRNDERHLLRGMYELYESQGPATDSTASTYLQFDDLLHLRSWNRSRLKGTINAQVRAGRIECGSGHACRLTPSGWTEAKRLVREHRLWEIYLITHADVAPSRVDRDADAIEHVLEPELIRELELSLANDDAIKDDVPPDPHGKLSGDQNLQVSRGR
jgi:manganese/zinc/iron transport system permease protein